MTMNADQPIDARHGMRVLPLVGPILGIVTAAAVIVYAVVPSPDGPTSGFILSLLPALVPALVLALLVGNPVREHPRRAVLLAMPPLAFGLIVATLLIRYPLPDATGLIIFGAVLSALPFFAAGFFAKQR